MVNRFCLVVSLITVVLLSSGCKTTEQTTPAEEPHRYNPEMFERDSRAVWQKVDEVIAAIGLKEGDAIADIGGGSGYFSRPFAKKVGETGVVYCCDIAPNLLEYVQTKAKEENLHNLVTVYSALDRPMLPLKSLDYIFFCDTNHHLTNRVQYYTDLKPLLRPGGKLVVIDWHKRQQPVGPPPDHNEAREVVIEEMDAAGWKLAREETFLPYQYFLVFTQE